MELKANSNLCFKKFVPSLQILTQEFEDRFSEFYKIEKDSITLCNKKKEKSFTRNESMFSKCFGGR